MGRHSDEDDSETEENCALDSRRAGNRPQALGQTLLDIGHLLLILIVLRAKYDEGQPF